MISIQKEGQNFLVKVKNKKPLEDLDLKFDNWDKLQFWLSMECEKHFKEEKPKKAIELFMRL